MYFRKEYEAEQYGSRYSACVELKTVHGTARPVIAISFSFASGAMRGGRNEYKEATDDMIAAASAALSGLMPREVFADALAEFGIDEGIAGCVRGYYPK